MNEIKLFPKLYKKAAGGGLQIWRIGVKGNIIHIKFGLFNGKQQHLREVISEGKNQGRSNETSPEQQALAEAESKWEHQVKKGYTPSKTKALAGKDDIAGGVNVMLAKEYLENKKRVVLPCLVNPKIDGQRCVAVGVDGKFTLWTRTRKPITSMPHIIEELEYFFPNQDIILDGELWATQYKHDFEKLMSICRQQKEPHKDHRTVEYHIFDIVNDGEPFTSRADRLRKFFKGINAVSKKHHLRRVPVYIASTYEEIDNMLNVMTNLGFEGVMVRNKAACYQNRRTSDLLKFKKFDDAEFEIVGIEEGKAVDRAGEAQSARWVIFHCITEDGTKFTAKLDGDMSVNQRYLQDESTWRGKRAQVKYQGTTGKNKVPRFPHAVAVRDYE